MSLEGKVAIVTGAARQRGIGRAIALRLASDGCDVAVIGSPRAPDAFPDTEKASDWAGAPSVVAEIEAMGRRAIAIDADLTKVADVERVVDETTARLGRIDVLVNNAGLAYCGEHNLWEIPDEQWYEVMDVNLNSVYLITSRVLRRMVEAKRPGRIINIASAAGRTAYPQYGAYCASKWGIVGLTQMLALETAPHQITVNCVAPGSVDTDMMDGTISHTATRYSAPTAGIKQAIVRTIALGRQGQPADIAAGVAYFASDDAAWVTGQTLNVSGGAPMS